jgi:hypothetical protein
MRRNDYKCKIADNSRTEADSAFTPARVVRVFYFVSVQIACVRVSVNRVIDYPIRLGMSIRMSLC